LFFWKGSELIFGNGRFILKKQIVASATIASATVADATVNRKEGGAAE